MFVVLRTFQYFYSKNISGSKELPVRHFFEALDDVLRCDIDFLSFIHPFLYLFFVEHPIHKDNLFPSERETKLCQKKRESFSVVVWYSEAFWEWSCHPIDKLLFGEGRPSF
nr:hypothetical protein MarFTME_296 [Marseillevirus futianmevirus]